MTSKTEQLKAEFEEIVLRAIGGNERERHCGCECGHEFRRLPPTRYSDVAEEAAIAFLSKLAEVEGEVDENTSDGFHTFKELYEHRHALYIALLRSHPKLSWRANVHSDGSMYPGWFIAGVKLPSGDITYHLPSDMWTNLDGSGIQTLHKAPEWDGHTSTQVLDRLLRSKFLETPDPQ